MLFYFSSPCVPSLYASRTGSRVKMHGHVPGLIKTHTVLGVRPRTEELNSRDVGRTESYSYFYQDRRIVYGPSTPRGCDQSTPHESGTEGSLCMWRHRASRDRGQPGSYNTPEPGIPMTRLQIMESPSTDSRAFRSEKETESLSYLTSGQSNSMCPNPPATCLAICFAL
jgi:hypothetical protein